MSFSWKKLLSSIIALLLCACGGTPSGALYYGALGFGKPKIIISNADATAPVQHTITMYDENGTLLKVLADYTDLADRPRGLTLWGSFSFLVPIEGTDRIDIVDIFGVRNTWATNAQFTGNIFKSVNDSSGNVYVIETNTIERFLASGERAQQSSATPYIAATLGTCVLSTPRGMAIAPTTGYLVVSNTGNDRVNIYNVNATPATCVSFNSASYTTADPLPILTHTNGSMYIGTQTADLIRKVSADGVTVSTAWSTSLTVMGDPTAIAELPDTNILVASDLTDSVERFSLDSTGNTLTRVGSGPFIKNAFTTAVTEILVIPGK
ncbi:MAG: hypothetical protein AB7F59_00025 [Bdellovibrionales bacterium]